MWLVHWSNGVLSFLGVLTPATLRSFESLLQHKMSHLLYLKSMIVMLFRMYRGRIEGDILDAVFVLAATSTLWARNDCIVVEG